MAFKFRDFWKILKESVGNITDVELYGILFGDDNFEPGNISKIVNGKKPVPTKKIRSIILQGSDEVEQRLIKIIPSESKHEIYKRIEGHLSILEKNNDDKCISEYLRYHKDDIIQKKIAHLFLASLTDNSKETSVSFKNIFYFLQAEEIKNIKEVSIMFHSGMNWYEDRSNNGRGALLKKIADMEIPVKILINNSKEVQHIFESRYLNGEYGIYDTVDVCTKKWIELAKKYKIALRSFEYIFFHSMCIIHHNDGTGKLYLSNYTYAKSVVEENPKLVISSENEDFRKYCEEYDFIWSKSTELYTPYRMQNTTGDGSNNV